MNGKKRECPQCKSDIIYKSKLGYENAIKNGSVCRKCASSGERNGMYGKVGDANPFFGKTHSKETLEKQSKVKLGKKHTKESLLKMKNLSSGDKNGMFGKTFYEVWVEKYGKEIADKKMIIYREKQSINNSGELNRMYGKPSPMGSGNGWSGWYKGWYFRSLRELTYMVKIIERFNLKWESAETNKYKIEYISYNGNKRNYFPDFIISDKYLIESKPRKLWSSDNVVRKKEAALIFCNNNNLIYKLIDIGVLTHEEIKSLYDNQLIKFLNRYEIKYQKLFVK